MKKIFELFSSIKLALTLIIVLVLLSILGSFISTTNPESGLIGFISKITGKHHQEVIFSFDKLGLLDVYHSKLFVFLLILFTLNLIVCTFYKLPNLFTLLKRDLKPNKAIFEKQNFIHLETEDGFDKVKERIDNIFHGYKVAEEKDEDGNYYITAEKGLFSRTGVYIVHLGLIIILLSGVLGGIFGYNGNVAILEGDSDDSVILKDNKTVKLPFSIKLNEFHVSYYDNSTKAKEFKSEIIISKKDKPDEAFLVEVNKPAKYENLKIYQASYGFYPSKDVVFKFLFKMGESQKKIQARMDEVVNIDDHIQFAVRDFAPSLSLDNEGRLINLSDMMINPAVIVEFFLDGESKGSVPILANYPQTGVFDGFELQFQKAYGVQFSVFSVNYNPFMNIIYAGFIVLSIGILIVFTMEHKLVYLRVKSVGDKQYIDIAGYRHRYKKDTERMLKEISEKI